MKTKKQSILTFIFKLAMAMLIVTAFSCSPDSILTEESPEANKSKNAIKAKEIARGAHIRGTNGINFGPDDVLYIASFYGQEIVAMNNQNGKILNRFGVNGYDVEGPDDLVFHPDGESIYFTDILTGFVKRMDLNGNVIDKSYLADGVNPITFTDDGSQRLFVALDFQGDGLYELDPDDLSTFREIIIPSATNPFPLGFFNAFDFGPDGLLYGPSFLRKEVIRVNVGEWGDATSSDPFTDGIAEVVNDDEDWEYPVAAKFGPDGFLTVLDQNGKVWKVDHNTGDKTLFTTLQPGLDNLAFDSEGNLYISNADFGWIIQILPSGQARTISGGGMIGPQGVAVLSGKNNKDAIFVGDLFRMRNFNGRTGKEEEVFKGYLVPETDKLTMPFSVQPDGNNLVVTSWFSGLVQSWSPKTNDVSEEYQMVFPIDAARVNGEIAVSDLGLGGVVWANSKNPILPIDGSSVFAPGGLATDGVKLWVADWGSGIVWEINFNGNTPNTPEPVATNLKFPEGLAFEKEGSLVVVETGTSSLLRIDLEKDPGDNVTTIVDGLELSGPSLPNSIPTWWFDGVAVGPSGDIYVTGGGANVLYRISKE
ncbi:hypothetical protein LCM02_12555 [Lutimonas saemankumensis]|uniref:hypothetical protein n=1 Tax=Lutimonas saemankumensis TaxID=483016 RepID=UPI001CD1C4EA|nr:hypothetical protein [Lutimonas saemankumensis]MCA0933285.1 hypothetical protein [Lutimonas saemankumensis]